MIDRIEFNVVQSENFVTTANKDTKKAVKFQSAARRVSLHLKKLNCVVHACLLSLFNLLILTYICVCLFLTNCSSNACFFSYLTQHLLIYYS
jgi:t-SNARE complex subunit (syntaxin)